MSLYRNFLESRTGPTRETLEFGLVAVLLAALPVFDAVVPTFAYRIESIVPGSVPGAIILGKSWFWVVLAMAVLGLAYGRIRNVPIPRIRPRAADARQLTVATIGPALVFLACLAAIHLLESSMNQVGTMIPLPALTPGAVWWNVVVPALLVGVGYAILFYGAILSAVRKTATTREALVATTVLVWLYHWAVDPTWRLYRSIVLLLVALCLVVGTAVATIEVLRLYRQRSRQTDLSTRALGTIPLAALLVLGIGVDVLGGAITGSDLVLAGGWLCTFAIASRTLDRCGSLWSAVLAITIFQAGILVAPTIEVATGFAESGV